MSCSSLFCYAVMGAAVILVGAQRAPTHSVTPTDFTTETTQFPTVTDQPPENVTADSQDRNRNPVFSVWEYARFQGPASRRPTPTTPPPATQPAAHAPSFDTPPSTNTNTNTNTNFSPCFWAIVLCCGADIAHEREDCFEEAKCPGAWIGNLCSEKLKSKVRRRLFG